MGSTLRFYSENKQALLKTHFKWTLSIPHQINKFKHLQWSMSIYVYFQELSKPWFPTPYPYFHNLLKDTCKPYITCCLWWSGRMKESKSYECNKGSMNFGGLDNWMLGIRPHVDITHMARSVPETWSAPRTFKGSVAWYIFGTIKWFSAARQNGSI